MMKWPKFEDLLGETIAAVDVADDNESVTFALSDGRTARLYHSPDCCESVQLEEVIGDWDDVTGSPILEAEVVTNSSDNPPECADSFTWSFYKLGTAKGYVTLRWLGESNGYYSEEVVFDLSQESASAA